MALALETDRQNDSGLLLRQLKLDASQRDGRRAPRRSRLVVTTGLLTTVLLTGAAAILVLRSDRFEVEAAVAVAPSQSAGPMAILQATGYVTARRQATVSAQITGTLTEVLIEEGEHVEAGQILAKLDNSAQMASVSQTRAQVEAAQAVLVQYDAQLAQGRRDLKRNEGLIDRHLVSEQTLETARTQVTTLEAQVDSQHRQVELARAILEAAEVQLGYTTLRAPFSGVVIAKAAQAGEIVSPTSAGGGFTRTGVGTLVDMESLEIEVDVNEAYINRVKSNQSAQAVLDAYPAWTIPSHVLAIIPTADRSKATVKVRVGIDVKDPRILPDMGVRVSFLEDAVLGSNKTVGDSTAGSQPKGVLLPGSSIVERDGKNVVFTVASDHAHAQPVELGQSYGDLRLVEGVATGTKVVRTPPSEMTDGAGVVIKKL